MPTSPVSDVEEFPAIPALPADALPDSVRPTVEAQNRAFQDWYEKINGFISLGSAAALEGTLRAHAGHINGELIIVTVPNSNTDFPVIHDLERIPLGFIELSQTAVDRLHRIASTPGNTTTQLWVRSAAAAGTRYLILVV